MTEKFERKFADLSRLIKRADLGAIRNALESGVSVNLENRYGYNLLMLAATQGNVPIGELLISKGANTRSVTPHGTTAVSLAAIKGHLRFLELLLEQGADPNSAPHGIPVEKWIPSCRFSPKKEAALVALIREYRTKISN
jgi:ankyrin repeat protein